MTCARCSRGLASGPSPFPDPRARGGRFRSLGPGRLGQQCDGIAGDSGRVPSRTACREGTPRSGTKLRSSYSCPRLGRTRSDDFSSYVGRAHGTVARRPPFLAPVKGRRRDEDRTHDRGAGGRGRTRGLYPHARSSDGRGAGAGDARRDRERREHAAHGRSARLFRDGRRGGTDEDNLSGRHLRGRIHISEGREKLRRRGPGADAASGAPRRGPGSGRRVGHRPQLRGLWRMARA